MSVRRNAYGRIPKRTRKRQGAPPAPTLTLFGVRYRAQRWDAPARATPIADIRAAMARMGMSIARIDKE